MSDTCSRAQEGSRSVTRREILRAGAMGAAALAATGAAPSSAEELGVVRRPNFLFVFSDEHRWCSLPFTQMPEVVAPALAAFAQQATSFDRCISNCPICVPYRSMLMTGLWPMESRIGPDNGPVVGVGTEEAGATIGRYGLAARFRAAGYATGYIGKWHLVDDSVYGAGFDYHKDWLHGDQHWSTRYRDVPSHEAYQTYTDYNAVGTTDQALEFLRAHAAEAQPFFLMLSWNPPHWRWDDAPEEYLAHYPEGSLPYRPNVTQRYKQGEYPAYYRHYHAHISAVDAQFRRLLDAIEALKIADDTVVIYTSDHGTSFGSNGAYSKRSAYDESNHVPFLIRWPGHIAAGARNSTLLSAIDLYPTLCGLAGLEPPAHCRGRDVSAAMLGQPFEPSDSIFVFDSHSLPAYIREKRDPGGPNWAMPYYGVVTDRHTYTVNYRGDELLFDNLADPYQITELAEDPSSQELKTGLRRKAEEWVRAAEDPFMPEELRPLDLPEKLSRLNEYLSWQRLRPRHEAYKRQRVAAFENRIRSDGQRRSLEEAVDQIVDRNTYVALDGVRADILAIEQGRTNAGPERLERLRSERDRIEQPVNDALRRAADSILGAE